MIILIIIAWWLMGFISAILTEYYMARYLTIGDIAMSIFLGIFGPVTMLAAIIHNVECSGWWHKLERFFNKRVF